MIIYLTGSTGFLGFNLIRLLNTKKNIKKIYCNIRDKNGFTGKERFKQIINNFKKCEYVENKYNIPDDTEYIILSGYNTSFNKTINFQIENSIDPIDKLCYISKNLKNLKKIIIISTAYVNPPYPYLSKNKLISFSGTKKSVEYYEKIKNKKISWKDIINDNNNNKFSKKNTYIFSKILMENYISEKYKDLPICFF